MQANTDRLSTPTPHALTPPQSARTPHIRITLSTAKAHLKRRRHFRSNTPRPHEATSSARHPHAVMHHYHDPACAFWARTSYPGPATLHRLHPRHASVPSRDLVPAPPLPSAGLPRWHRATDNPRVLLHEDTPYARSSACVLPDAREMRSRCARPRLTVDHDTSSSPHGRSLPADEHSLRPIGHAAPSASAPRSLQDRGEIRRPRPPRHPWHTPHRVTSLLPTLTLPSAPAVARRQQRGLHRQRRRSQGPCHVPDRSESADLDDHVFTQRTPLEPPVLSRRPPTGWSMHSRPGTITKAASCVQDTDRSPEPPHPADARRTRQTAVSKTTPRAPTSAIATTQLSSQRCSTSARSASSQVSAAARCGPRSPDCRRAVRRRISAARPLFLRPRAERRRRIEATAVPSQKHRHSTGQ